MNAIVYTFNTSFTAQYAKLLGEKLNLPVYSLDAVKKSLTPALKLSISAG